MSQKYRIFCLRSVILRNEQKTAAKWMNGRTHDERAAGGRAQGQVEGNKMGFRTRERGAAAIRLDVWRRSPVTSKENGRKQPTKHRPIGGGRQSARKRDSLPSSPVPPRCWGRSSAPAWRAWSRQSPPRPGPRRTPGSAAATPSAG